jgi:hypothetical protein
MSKAPPRRQRTVFRPLARPQLEGLLARHGTPLLAIDCASIRRPYSALATDFNFIPRAKVIAVNRRPGRQRAD